MEHWLDAIYRDHAPPLFRFLCRLTRCEADTQDILQDLFVRLAKSPHLLDGVAAPRSYLFRMAHRLLIDHARRKHTREGREDHAARERNFFEPPAPSTGDAAWRQASLAAALEALPSEQKAVLVLKVWEKMTFAEIATVLEIPPNTAASRYRYALDKLRDALRPLHNDLS